MDDKALTELLAERSEEAIGKIKEKYGAYCRYIAGQILGDCAEDIEEVENDVLLKLWRADPPPGPDALRSYLGMLTRQTAVDKRRNDPKRRLPEDAFLDSLDELAEAIPDPENMENAIVDRLALREALNRFLQGLSEKERRLFLLRYWYACPIREIAEEVHAREGAIKMRLRRLRDRLWVFLNEEDLWNE